MEPLRTYAHAHSPLGPALRALGSLVLPLGRAYLVLSFLAALVGAAALFRLLEEMPGISREAAWGVWSLGVTHFLFVKIVARTSTDGFGYAFTTVGLLLACRLARAEAWRLRDVAGLVLVLCVGLFARPTVIPLPPALAASLLFVAWREGRLDRTRAVRALAIGVLPLALFFGTFAAAGLGQSFALAHEKMAIFAGGRTGDRLLICLAVLLQALVVPLVASVRRRPVRPEVVLGLSWAAASVSLVLVGATFWNRHFAHALPGLLIAAAPGMESLFARFPRAAPAAVTGVVAANLFLLAVTLYRDVGFGAPYLLQ
jgi:hypothetical protein